MAQKFDLNSARDDSLHETSFETIEEGDIVKTDGAYLYVASNHNPSLHYSFTPDPSAAMSTLTVLDVRDVAHPPVVSSLEFEQPIADLFLSDGQLTVITASSVGLHAWYGHAGPREYTVYVLDMFAPAEPRMAFRTTVEGAFVEARVVDNQLMVVGNEPTGERSPSIYSIPPSDAVITSPAS